VLTTSATAGFFQVGAGTGSRGTSIGPFAPGGERRQVAMRRAREDPGMEQWTAYGIERLGSSMEAHVASGSVAGLAWAVARRGEVAIGASGSLEGDGLRVVDDRSIFRISSMTKPVTAVAALALVEDGVLRLDDPVDRYLPELADRRVLRDPSGPLGDTVPADRPVTLRDLLTFRFGLGMDFAFSYPQAGLAAMADAGLGVGPPAPRDTPAPDEWMRRLGDIPLERQPGERWLYHTSADVLGVLVGRAAGASLGAYARDRIFEPLEMRDTGFSVAPGDLDRFGPVFRDESGTRVVHDPPDGEWSAPPAFEGGGAGLVSTLRDYLAFASMLAGGGTHDGVRILARPTVDLMTTNHLTAEQLVTSAPGAPEGTAGWGFGVSVQLRRLDGRSVGTYGWDGGFGTVWSNDPAEEVVGVLMTNQMWASPDPPPVMTDFWTATYTAFAD
jgi:CubicO group peptidase (beta-lactamase class C family)